MRDIWNLGLKLFLIAAVAGLALGVTNAVTAGPIAAQSALEADQARRTVLPEAVSFEQTDADGLDEAFLGLDGGGNVLGATGKLTVSGYGGEIEVTVGMTKDGTIAGINVGGTNFKETAGLGAKTKDAAFTAQFAGETAPVALRKDGGTIDAVTSATISSTACTNAVNQISAALTAVLSGR